MKVISRDELEKEYDLIFDENLKYLNSRETQGKCWKTKNYVYTYTNSIEKIIKYNNDEARSKMSTCIDIVFDAEVDEKDKKKIINKIINKTMEDMDKMDRTIKKYIEKKYEYKNKLDNDENSREEYDEYIKNISGEEQKVFADFMKGKLIEFGTELHKLELKMFLKWILKIIGFILVGVFLFKNAKKIKEVAKDLTLVLSKENIKAIREKNKIKALETTKDIALECINKTKPLEKGITLNM